VRDRSRFQRRNARPARRVAGRARAQSRGKGEEARGADPLVRCGAGGAGSPGNGGHQKGPQRSPSRTPRRGPTHCRVGREESTALVPLGMSHIPVSELPVSISDALPVLDSAADHLRRLDQILGARLEAEGRKLCRAVVDYVLTCFRSHDPAISLAPVIDGPVAATEDVVRESVQDAVEMVVAHFQRDPADAE
jgi:hypothetical protein